jgi:hypothetical protein
MPAHRRRRLTPAIVLVVVLALTGLALVGTALADQAPPGAGAGQPLRDCPPDFSADARTADPPAGHTHPGTEFALSVDPIDQVRVGRHDPCYDRVVLDVAGNPGGVRVAYVDEVISDPKGDTLTVPGQARLLVAAGNTIAHRAGGPQAGDEMVPTARLASFGELRSVIFAGSFENVTSFGVGVAEPRPFRVFVLPPGPGHPKTGMIVVDVMLP